MGQIGVDLDHGLVILVEGDAERVHIGIAEPSARVTLDQPKTSATCIDSAPNDRTGVVDRCVVDHEKIRTGDVAVETVEQFGDVVGLVVSRDDDERSHHGMAPKTAYRFVSTASPAPQVMSTKFQV